MASNASFSLTGVPSPATRRPPRFRSDRAPRTLPRFADVPPQPCAPMLPGAGGGGEGCFPSPASSRIRDSAPFIVKTIARTRRYARTREGGGSAPDGSPRRCHAQRSPISRRERKAGGVASRAFDAYFRPIIEERRAAPREDIVSALVRAQDEGEQLSERETLNMLRLLLSAGTETTANLIGNGILALLRNPDQLQRLRDDPALIPAAVEELLRFDSPVQADFRRVLENCEVNGFPLRKRDNIVLLLGAANRDPDVFVDPDRLDIDRRQGRHLSFGGGIHHCLGAPLARLEGRIVLEMLLDRFKSMRLLGDRPRFRQGIVLRGLQSLQVKALP